MPKFKAKSKNLYKMEVIYVVNVFFFLQFIVRNISSLSAWSWHFKFYTNCFCFNVVNLQHYAVSSDSMAISVI